MRITIHIEDGDAVTTTSVASTAAATSAATGAIDAGPAPAAPATTPPAFTHDLRADAGEPAGAAPAERAEGDSDE